MKKIVLALALVVTVSTSIFAQKKVTTSATVSFDASTSLDDLPKADNKTVIAAVNTTTGDVQFEVTVKNFDFSNPTMQEHFNSANWLNSDKYPKFIFKGKIDDLSKVNFSKDGTYSVTVTGDLTIKEISKSITVPAIVKVKGGAIDASSAFSFKLSDYEITGTPIKSGKVSGEPKITVAASFK